ncbi:hypothetical protein MXL88_14970, partial [Acinetobacter haemolyticus]|nr:hypothetical protein [Acinetobacter haemolyticus]
LSGFGKAATGQKFSVDHMDVQKWVTAFEQYGISGLSVKTTKSQYSQADRDKTQEQLLEELAYLRAEVALLKKRRALRLEQEAK